MAVQRLSRRRLRFGIRTVLVAMFSLALLFAYVSATTRAYQHEQRMINQISRLHVAPVVAPMPTAKLAPNPASKFDPSKALSLTQLFAQPSVFSVTNANVYQTSAAGGSTAWNTLPSLPVFC